MDLAPSSGNHPLEVLLPPASSVCRRVLLHAASKRRPVRPEEVAEEDAPVKLLKGARRWAAIVPAKWLEPCCSECSMHRVSRVECVPLAIFCINMKHTVSTRALRA